MYIDLRLHLPTFYMLTRLPKQPPILESHDNYLKYKSLDCQSTILNNRTLSILPLARAHSIALLGDILLFKPRSKTYTNLKIALLSISD
jgi:hypothetical protein